MVVFMYPSDSNVFVRLFSHVSLALRPTVDEYHTGREKNILEKIGDTGLWMIEHLPGKIVRVLKDPRVVTFALTVFALIGDSYLFYPTHTTNVLRAVVDILPQIPVWAPRLALYILSVITILSYAARAEGRFMNKNLMDRFYGISRTETISPRVTMGTVIQQAYSN